jgi:site-specific DNA-methyltransferase (adenine-specific)
MVMDESSKGHPTPKPVKLIEELFKIKGDAIDVVLDMFCGGGSTLVACQNLGRKGRGIEISPAYVAVTLERMATAFPELEIRKIDG